MRPPRPTDTLLTAALLALLAYIGLRLIQAVTTSTAEAVSGAAVAVTQAIQTPPPPPAPSPAPQYTSPAEALSHVPWYLQPRGVDPTDDLIPDDNTRPRFTVVPPGYNPLYDAASGIATPRPNLAGEQLDTDGHLVPGVVDGAWNGRGPAA